MSGKVPDFESADYDSAEILKEDARIDANEAAADAQRRAAADRAFETSVLQYAVSSCLNSCLDCLDLLYIPRESQPISNVAIQHDSWRQEAEPEPCSRDSWLRGAIPEAPVLATSNSSLSVTSISQAALGRSVTSTPKASRPLSRTSVAHRSSTTSSAAEQAANAAGSGSLKHQISKSKSSARASSADRNEAASGQCLEHTASNCKVQQKEQHQQPAGQRLPHQQQDAEDRLRQELQIRRQQEAVTRDMREKAEQARAALIAVQKELKGKDYTYDASGKLVLLNKVNPEHLPAPPGPQFKVHAAASADADAAAEAGKKGSTLGRSTSRAAGALSSVSSSHRNNSTSSSNSSRRSKEPAISPSDFKQTASQTQPPVLETLKPAAGVTLRAGNAAKVGPKREVSGQTRAQYQQQAKALNQQATRVVAAGAAGRVSAIGARTSMISPVPAAAAAVGGRASSAASTQSAADKVGRASPSPSVAGAATTAAGRNSSAGSHSSATASLLSLSGAAASGGNQQPAPADIVATAAAQQPSSPDVNLVLVSAPDWGAVGNSGGYCPPSEDTLILHKATDKQMKEEFGRTSFLPKARSSSQMLKPGLH